MPTIGVCTSARESNIRALLSKLGSLRDTKIKFIQLPYNDLDSFRLEPGSMDGLILCHSIHNRRFAITDVMDAIYDTFLPHARSVLGRDNVATIAHDFNSPMGSDHASLQDSFRIRQPTTFQCSSLAMICGKLDTEVQMDGEDWQQLEKFVANVQLMTLVPGILPRIGLVISWIRSWLNWVLPGIVVILIFNVLRKVQKHVSLLYIKTCILDRLTWVLMSLIGILVWVMSVSSKVLIFGFVTIVDAFRKLKTVLV